MWLVDCWMRVEGTSLCDFLVLALKESEVLEVWCTCESTCVANTWSCLVRLGAYVLWEAEHTWDLIYLWVNLCCECLRDLIILDAYVLWEVEILEVWYTCESTCVVNIWDTWWLGMPLYLWVWCIWEILKDLRVAGVLEYLSLFSNSSL